MSYSPITQADYDGFIAELEQAGAHYGVNLADPEDDLIVCVAPFRRRGVIPQERNGKASNQLWARAMRVAENRAKHRASAAGFHLNELLGYIA